MNKVITNASSEIYLMIKVWHDSELTVSFAFKTILYFIRVVVIFGIYETCPRKKLANITVYDRDDKVSVIVVIT